MSLLTSSIDLDTITLPRAVASSQFPESQIENLANLFLKAGDTISPILLRKISPIAFEVLEGHFEYYAALKAQEINDQFTAIRAYVVPPDLESTILEQYNFLRSRSTSAPQAQPDLANIETAIANRLEQKLSTTIDRIVEERINSSLKVFANQITQQLNSHLLDFKQSLSLAPISQVLSSTKPSTPAPDLAPEKIAKSKTPKTTKAASPKPKSSKSKDSSINNDDPKVLQVLHDLNTMNFADLQRKLAQSKNTKFARLIDEQRLLRSEQKFQSVQDVIANVQGLAEKTMQKIIDAW